MAKFANRDVGPSPLGEVVGCVDFSMHDNPGDESVIWLSASPPNLRRVERCLRSKVLAFVCRHRRIDDVGSPSLGDGIRLRKEVHLATLERIAHSLTKLDRSRIVEMF